MPFSIIRNDLTKIHVDAIVNAANTMLKMGGGVCGTIFKAAGEKMLQAACDKLAPLQTGDAVITPGFGLPAKYIIHAAGPVYRNGKQGEEKLLRTCYINSLKRAVENNCRSIAFPLISSGIYGYPKEEALRVATGAIKDFLVKHELRVFLVVYDKAAFTVSRKLLGAVKAYIDENYVQRYKRPRRNDQLLPVEREALENAGAMPHMVSEKTLELVTSIGDLFDKLDEPFSVTLLRLIDAKGRADVEVYKRANLSRKLFSKIRKRGYMPGKRTVIALAIALELNLEETDDLLKRAGYALSHSRKFDVIIEYFILNGKYDIFKINEVLFKYDQPLLGG